MHARLAPCVPLCVTLLYVALSPARAAGPATAPSTSMAASLDAALDGVDAKAAAHRDLVASFVQEKRSPLLQKPIVTRGVIHARGDVQLWASTSPQPTRMRIDPTRLSIYYERQRTVEEFPIQSQLGAIASSPLPRLAALRERFAIAVDAGPRLDGATSSSSSSGTLQLRLVPTDVAIQPYVDHVRVLLDSDRGLVRVFEVVDPDGETTRVTFDDVKTDTNFADAALALDAPADAKVSRPLEAK